MDDDYDQWIGDFGPINQNSGPSKSARNRRYSNAYGNYHGGYGPDDGYGPPPFGPRFPMGSRGPPMGPQGPLMGPRGPPMGPPLHPGPPMPFRHHGFNGPPFPMGFPQDDRNFQGFGRGFGPDGPPMITEKAIRYLIRCGFTKESLKNMPRELLRLITPQYCGLCAMEFDSFVMSRLHYISKNHHKKQKKWFFQNENAPQHRSKVPFKSRDLYCELCDVQITSKVHAESHYAGRPHRAVVEGKKPPKNPALQEWDMQERLAQLLRREKKSLKPLPEAEKTEAYLETVKKTQPELYCDICKLHEKHEHAPVRAKRLKHRPAPWLTAEIQDLMATRNAAKSKYKRTPTEHNLNVYKRLRNRCNKLCRDALRRHNQASEDNADSGKTAVTCAEQMTNHMNGKRHLSKEKQHIFQMMKGETPSAVVDNNESTEATAEESTDGKEVNATGEGEEEGEGEGEEKPKEAQDNGEDWGEAWE